MLKHFTVHWVSHFKAVYNFHPLGMCTYLEKQLVFGDPLYRFEEKGAEVKMMTKVALYALKKGLAFCSFIDQHL